MTVPETLEVGDLLFWPATPRSPAEWQLVVKNTVWGDFYVADVLSFESTSANQEIEYYSLTRLKLDYNITIVRDGEVVF